MSFNSPASPSPLSMPVFQSLFDFHDLESFEESSQILCRISRNLLDLFLTIRLSLWVWEEPLTSYHAGVGVYMLS